MTNIKNLLNSEKFSKVINRSVHWSELQPTINELNAHWSYDLYKRKPAPAMHGVSEDLDLACFLSALVDRGAIINIPHYRSRKAGTQTEGEHRLQSQNRHGQVLGLVANSETFAFSIRIKDMTVLVSSEEGNKNVLGAPRTFNLTDATGSWWSGWDCVEFLPSAKENGWLTDKKLWTDNKINFSHFVHPNRWISVYGQYYILTKALVARLTDEAHFYGTEIKRLNALGIVLSRKEYPKTVVTGESKSTCVEALTAILDVPWIGEFIPIPNTLDAAVEAQRQRQKLNYVIIPNLKFAIRVTEYAFYKAGMKERKPPKWIKNIWTTVKERRTMWNSLIIGQVKDQRLVLKYRTFKKTERIAI